MEDNEHGVKIFSEDNTNNLSAHPTLVSGEGIIYQQYQQLGINNINNNARYQLVYKSLKKYDNRNNRRHR